MLSLFLSVMVIFSIWFYVQRKKRMTILKRNGIVGPQPNLIFGNMIELMKEPNVQVMDRWIKKYGKIFGYYMGGVPLVCVSDEELIKKIQVKDFDKFVGRHQLAKDMISTNQEIKDSFTFGDANKWKICRAIASPAFNSSKLKLNMDIMNESSDILINKIDQNVNKETNFLDLYRGLAMDVITKSAFGINTDCQNSSNHPFLRAVLRAIYEFEYDPLLFLNIILPEFDAVIYNLRVMSNMFSNYFRLFGMNKLINIARNTVEMRRKDHLKPNDLLQLMLDTEIKDDEQIISETKNQKHNYTDSEVVGNSAIFILAGYETTNTTLSFATHSLVNNLDLQDRIRDEVNSVVQKYGELNYESLKELNLIAATINETLRLYPPSPLFTTRKPLNDYVYNDIIIPKEAGIVIPIYSLHRSPEYWVNPDKFDETRFTDSTTKVNPAIYQPFGFGPRQCIASRFAILEMKLTLAKILQKYRLQPGPNTKIGDPDINYQTINITLKELKLLPVKR